jgi:hypothetical protein
MFTIYYYYYYYFLITVIWEVLCSSVCLCVDACIFMALGHHLDKSVVIFRQCRLMSMPKTINAMFM